MSLGKLDLEKKSCFLKQCGFAEYLGNLLVFYLRGPEIAPLLSLSCSLTL